MRFYSNFSLFLFLFFLVFVFLHDHRILLRRRQSGNPTGCPRTRRYFDRSIENTCGRIDLHDLLTSSMRPLNRFNRLFAEKIDPPSVARYPPTSVNIRVSVNHRFIRASSSLPLSPLYSSEKFLSNHFSNLRELLYDAKRSELFPLDDITSQTGAYVLS